MHMQNRKRLTDVGKKKKNKTCAYQRGEGWEREELGVWD